MIDFDEIIGQTQAKAALSKYLELFTHKDVSPGPILLIAPDGMGKETIACEVANRLQICYQQLEAEQILIKGDLTAVLTNVRRKQVLFINNLHRLKVELRQILETCLRDLKLEFIIGQGPSQRQHVFDVQPFTLIGSIPSPSDCPSDIRQIFDLTVKLEAYTETELVILAHKIFHDFELVPEKQSLELIVANSDRTPGGLKQTIAKIARVHSGPITENETSAILSALGLLRNRSLSVANNPQELSGTEFEHFIASLIQQMGFRAEVTKASGDGGIDIVAHSDRPILGGRYLFQCKRFQEGAVIGAPVVREFYGALSADKKAVKGVLITTSKFTEQARGFADQVNIELIDGEQLKSLLNEYGAFDSPKHTCAAVAPPPK